MGFQGTLGNSGITPGGNGDPSKRMKMVDGNLDPVPESDESKSKNTSVFPTPLLAGLLHLFL